MERPKDRPRREGLAEYLIVMCFLAIAAAGAVAIFGQNIRSLFAPPRGSGTAPATSASTSAAPPDRSGRR